jgi:hypothetical protein
MTNTCRSCSQPIEWARTPDSRAIPLDPAVVPVDARGALVIVPDGRTDWAYGLRALVEKVSLKEGVSEQRARELIDEQFEARLSHFATCPDSHKHRRR